MRWVLQACMLRQGKLESQNGKFARKGVINVCSENDLFHDPGDVILTSWMAISEVVNNDNDNELTLI